MKTENSKKQPPKPHVIPSSTSLGTHDIPLPVYDALKSGQLPRGFARGTSTSTPTLSENDLRRCHSALSLPRKPQARREELRSRIVLERVDTTLCRQYGPWHPSRIALLIRKAMTASSPQEAENLYLCALAICEENYGSLSMETLGLIHTLSVHYQRHELLERASHCLSVARLAHSARRNTDEEIAVTEHLYGKLKEKEGDYASARDAYCRALQRTPVEKVKERITLMLASAHCLELNGDTEQASITFKKMHELLGRADAAHKNSILRSHVYRKQSQFIARCIGADQADKAAVEALRVLATATNCAEEARALALLNLGSLELQLGKIDSAQHSLEQAAAMFERTPIGNNRSFADTCDLLADIHLQRKEYTLATQYIRRSRNVRLDHERRIADHTSGVDQ